MLAMSPDMAALCASIGTALAHRSGASGPFTGSSMTAGAGSGGQRVGDEPAFLLHMVPYRETSLVVDLFSRNHGRIGAVAKGAKRPRSALRAVLLQFQPLAVGWSGRNELRTLTGAEWRGGLTSPAGQALLSAFYMNELLIRLLPREDPHPMLFDGYETALGALSDGASIDETLRRFEWLLLRETGYAPDLAHDAEGRPITAHADYAWSPGGGFRPALAGEGGTAVSGRTLIALDSGQFENPDSRQQAKYLTRAVLASHLDGAQLNTRQILMDLQRL
jgi:DNA repair protein RecO (recombination protein O)